MKQKIAEFSFLHVFAILLVVLGHSFYQTNSLIVDWMYQFQCTPFLFRIRLSSQCISKRKTATTSYLSKS